mgnify:CR=1 FL=1|tara:strand:+ start:3415 stop:4305 length:891 start_codon:yes stop_codon:yes gene_type:complete
MSAVVSFATLRVAPGVRTTAPKRRDVRQPASLNDKINELKSNLPDVPKIDLPNVSVPKFEVPGKAGGASSSPGYKPTGGDDLYVGQGRYIPDDKDGFVSKTGRDGDGTLVGGFAGGEKGLWKYRDERLADDEASKPKEWKPVYGGRKGTKEVDLSKDFGGMAGGFPGGEIGVKAYNATGTLATRDSPPTIGWGPPVFLLLAIGTAGYYLNPGDPSEELGAVVTGASATKATLDSALTAEQQTLGLEVVGGALVTLALINAAGGLAKKAAGGVVDAAKLGLLGAATLAIAGKVLELY